MLTMTKTWPPFLPRALVHWSYGMMAPYQGDTSWNADFRYEGLLNNGKWETIDLARYMPYGFGERNVRKFLRIYQTLDTDGQRSKFNLFAQQVLALERKRGIPYQAVRVTYEQWPRSPAGYEYLHLPAFTTYLPITEVR